MAKHTPRDHVWHIALELKEAERPERFQAPDVVKEMDDPPSERTVHDTLVTMHELGHLGGYVAKGRARSEFW